MKKIFTFFMLLCSGLAVFAQSNIRKAETDYHPKVINELKRANVIKNGEQTLVLKEINTDYTFISFEYDENYRLIREIRSDIDYLEYNMKDEFEYDEKGNVTRIKYFSAVDDPENFVWTAYEEFEYDENNRKSVRINGNNLGTGFIIGGEGFYDYDQRGRLSRYVQLFNMGSVPYDSLSISYYHYNDETNAIESETVYSLDEHGDWYCSDSTRYYFDELNRVTERSTYSYYLDAGWLKSFKMVWTYENNSVYWTEKEFFLANQAGTNWASSPEERFIMRYEDTDAFVHYPCETSFKAVEDLWFLQEQENRKYINEEDWWTINLVDNALTFIETAVYEYETVDGALAIEENEQTATSIFPNPANESIVIENLEKGFVDIYSLTGEKVLSFPYSAGETINVSSLKSGIYIVKISTENGISASKLIKQ